MHKNACVHCGGREEREKGENFEVLTNEEDMVNGGKLSEE